MTSLRPSSERSGPFAAERSGPAWAEFSVVGAAAASGVGVAVITPIVTVGTRRWREHADLPTCAWRHAAPAPGRPDLPGHAAPCRRIDRGGGPIDTAIARHRRREREKPDPWVGLPTAPAIGLEPITVRLTVGCSAIELRGNGVRREVNSSNHRYRRRIGTPTLFSAITHVDHDVVRPTPSRTRRSRARRASTSSASSAPSSPSGGSVTE